MVKYKYDAYGNCEYYDSAAADLAETNPIRYRSYYYDQDTGLYYLQTRYYSPIWRRFISPDSTSYIEPETPTGLNLYCYCGNDPVNNYDPTGHFTLPNWVKWVIGGVAFAGAVALTVFSGGTLAPVLIGMGVGIASSSLVGGAISSYNGEGFWSGFADGAADGAMWGGNFALVSAGISAIRYTRGFRVVNLNEYDDIARAGKFTSKGFAEGKYFWASKSSAKAFASQIGDDAYRIVGMRVSRFGLKSALEKGTAYYWSSLDGIGRAFYVEIGVVNQLVSRIWTAL